MPAAAQFRFMPLSEGRELFLPLRPPAATAGGLALYAPMHPAARAYRGLMVRAVRRGLAPFLLRSRPLSDKGGLPHLHHHGLVETVRAALKRPDAEFAIYQGKEAVVRKPTLLAMEPDGRPIAYAKIGWNEASRHLVEQEHQALVFLGRQALQHGRVAPVLGYLDLGHSRVLISTPLHHVNAAAEFALTPLHVAFLREVGSRALTLSPLAQSAFWTRANERLGKLRAKLTRRETEILEAALRRLSAGFGDATLPWTLRLGDFLPWNFGLDKAAQRIDVVDLEFAERGSPLGWDVFHFLIGIRQPFRPVDIAAQAEGSPFRDYFAHFGIGSERLPYLQLAYLVDLTLFFRYMWGDQTPVASAERNMSIRLDAISTVLRELGEAPATR